MYKIKTVRGEDVPVEARELSRGDEGVTQYLYDTQREHMIATLLYRKDTLIGWSCAIRSRSFNWFGETSKYSNKVEVHVFVDTKYRGKGFAKKLISRILWVVRLSDPKSVVSYGAPDDCGFFNKTYEKTLKRHKLKSTRWYF